MLSSAPWWGKLVVWLILWFGYSYWEFGTIFFIVSSIAFVWFNLGEKKPGEASAYSIFNQNFSRLLGDKDWQQIENEIRNIPSQSTNASVQGIVPGRGDTGVKDGKLGRNQPCPCGSELKYKKCCYRSDESDESHSD
eukprot:c4100_g1_i1.p1 GENE.c4100_g1_i1~~c4100_g1_i1.p1  ORF type:complete len:137 (+),score=21.77 c4100_g1_i1:27-437(+)